MKVQALGIINILFLMENNCNVILICDAKIANYKIKSVTWIINDTLSIVILILSLFNIILKYRMLQANNK